MCQAAREVVKGCCVDQPSVSVVCQDASVRMDHDMVVRVRLTFIFPCLCDDDSFMSCIVDNNIGDEGIRALAGSLKHLPQLQTLNLSSMVPICRQLGRMLV